MWDIEFLTNITYWGKYFLICIQSCNFKQNVKFGEIQCFLTKAMFIFMFLICSVSGKQMWEGRAFMIIWKKIEWDRGGCIARVVQCKLNTKFWIS
jgi:hypothetical protein